MPLALLLAAVTWRAVVVSTQVNLTHLNIVRGGRVAAQITAAIANRRGGWGSRLVVMPVIVPGRRLSAGRGVRSILGGILSLDPVIFLGTAGINGWEGYSALSQFSFALLTQMLLEQCCIAGVCTEYCVNQITEEWNQPNHEIEDDVDQHLESDAGREASVHLTACPVHHECHEGIKCISSRRDKTDYAAPAKADAHKIEKGHVKTICASLDLGQDLAIVLRDAWWQGLLALLEFACRSPVESGSRDLLKVWILFAKFILNILSQNPLADDIRQ